jgi:hypothetical protein
MAAMPNPQLWYTSSAPLPRVESDTLRRLCKRGRTGAKARRKTGKLAYFEWSAAEDADLESEKAIRQANPALGIRISADFIETERGALEPSDFARERLGIFPEEVDGVDAVLPEEDWKACADHRSTAVDPVALAFEVSLDRKWSQIAASAPSTNGGRHVELIENRRGTGWVVDRLIQMRDGYTDSDGIYVPPLNPSAVVCNVAGPAGALLKECELKGLVVGMPDGETAAGEPKYRQISGRDYAQACGAAFDEVTDHKWRHLDQPALNMAASNAAKRPMGDAWVFDRKGAIDISPISCVALAAWAAERVAAAPKESEFIVV